MTVTVQLKKKCSRCGDLLFISEFHKRADRPLGVVSHCKTCEKARASGRKVEHVAYNAKSYAKNKEKVNKRSKVVGDVKMQKIDEIKQQPCMDCGNTFPTECMDFDHRDPSLKEFDLSRARWKKWEEIEAEIAKCDLVCACCHRTRTKKAGLYRTNGLKAHKKRAGK